MSNYLQQQFDNRDFAGEALDGSEFDDCTFTRCNFSKADLRNVQFIDCRFVDCDLSNSQLDNSGIKSVVFTGCKLMGIDFGKCSDFLFAVSFTNCQLDYCSFYKRKMKKTVFSNCSMKDADFTEVDLSLAVFSECDLLGAVFLNSNIEKADFRTARNYSIDPEANKVKKARFSLDGVVGLLGKYGVEVE